MGGDLSDEDNQTTAPPPPPMRFCLGVTGHGDTHPSLEGEGSSIQQALAETMGAIARMTGQGTKLPTEAAPTRLMSLLANRIDLMAEAEGRRLGFETVAVLGGGRRLHLALASRGGATPDMGRILAGEAPHDPDILARLTALEAALDAAWLFELAEQDAAFHRHFPGSMPAGDPVVRDRLKAWAESRTRLAARVMLSHCDLLVAVWDGQPDQRPGSTADRIAIALDLACPVLWIDALDPAARRILRAPEQLPAPRQVPVEQGFAGLASIVDAVLNPPQCGPEFCAFDHERWRDQSTRLWHGYRRVEALFAGDGRPFRSLTQRYERPGDAARGSFASLIDRARRLPGVDPRLIDRIEPSVIRRFAFADGVSAHLSDRYRGGMTANFLLSALAIITGLAYQPLVSADEKWMFASAEFLFLSTIILVTFLGRRQRWHGRWFETRRVAEYLRHTPVLLLLGAGRPPGHWPRGADNLWPEHYCQAALRDLGLPRMTLTAPYLRALLSDLLDRHLVEQRDYHRAKAERLEHVHHKLDRVSSLLFVAAVVAVSIFLFLSGLAGLGLLSWPAVVGTAKSFTFLGVMLPTLGAALAGIRYFGDFERFAAISQMTAERLDSIHGRLGLLLAAPDEALDYGLALDLAEATDEAVIAEIENWQAVFGGKHISVPV